MSRGRTQPFLRYLFKLLAVYFALAALWPLVRSTYDNALGGISAPLIEALTYDDVSVVRHWNDDKLRFQLVVTSKRNGEFHHITAGVDPLQYGFAHITFAALALTIPGWAWRRRLVRWIAGASLLQCFFVLMVLLNILGGISHMRYAYWSGDLISTLFPTQFYLNYKNFLSIVGEQAVPVVLWLGLFVYPRRHDLLRGNAPSTQRQSEWAEVTPVPTSR